ncbi:MAG TPA: nucleoside 2-deoxyribosyltransferase domain-containing protein [Trebonia sp.]|nr:nucleoside 2-deoxyribosyltransferase domain-containing protein [Trebonia sp.]
MLTRPENLRLVYAADPLPEEASVFLAGPTPRSDDVPPWRPAAVRELAAQWHGPGPLAVILPEPPGGQRWPYFDEQAEWETVARQAATAILFWIPRDVRTLPGFTTNVEFGLDVTTGRAVLGCPPDCPSPEHNRYLIWLARRHGVPVTATLPATVAAALALIAGAP